MKESSQEYLALLGYTYLRYGKTAEAITILEGLAVLAPTNDWVPGVLAYAYLREEQFQKCLDQLQQRGTTNRSNNEQLLEIRALWGLGRRDEARRLLDQMQGRLRETDG